MAVRGGGDGRTPSRPRRLSGGRPAFGSAAPRGYACGPMPDGTPPPPAPSYWTRLGVPEPDLAAIAANRTVTLRHLALAVILLRSRPVSLDELVETIGALGSRGAGPRLRTSIVKALAAAAALVRLPDGRFDVDLTAKPTGSWFRIAVFDSAPAPPPSNRSLRPPAPGDRAAVARRRSGARSRRPALRRRARRRVHAGHGEEALRHRARRARARRHRAARLGRVELESFLSALTAAKGFWSSRRSGTSRRRSSIAARTAGSNSADAATLAPDARAALRRARARVREALADDASGGPGRAICRSPGDMEGRRTAGALRGGPVRAPSPRPRLPARGEGRRGHGPRRDGRARRRRSSAKPRWRGCPRCFARLRRSVGLDLRAVLVALGQLNAPAARVVDLASTPRTRRIGRRLVKLTTADWLEGSLGAGAALEDPARAARDYAGGTGSGSSSDSSATRRRSSPSTASAWSSAGCGSSGGGKTSSRRRLGRDGRRHDSRIRRRLSRRRGPDRDRGGRRAGVRGSVGAGGSPSRGSRGSRDRAAVAGRSWSGGA